ncbi:MAG TPA: hypothetical protein VHC19_02310 [Pirellulales bacterium]|jgi:hypothetical protein|nr:hypothetical protein [Pirellulales bacterium]
MTKIIHGIVHGRTIELSEDPGVADGAEVEVVVKAAPPAKTWGDGIRRSAGALADSWTEEDDQILQQIHFDRSRENRDIPK